MTMKEINLEEILDSIYDKNYRSNYKTLYSKQCILEAMKEACTQVLELAAENAEITIVNEWDGIETGNKKVVVVDKQSILDVINQVK